MFAHMYEDHGIEQSALAASRRILAVASAGDTALALARGGAEVTAIDINPAQIAYLQGRVGGRCSYEATTGQAERILAAGRGILRLAGWRRDRMERFCQLGDPGQQVAEWRRLMAGLPGLALRGLLTPAALRAAYRPEFARWAADLGRRLPARIEGGLARHPNRDNPWARQLFLGGRLPAPVDAAERLTTVVGDVAGHLERVDPGRYDGFALSNVADGASPAYAERLRAAIGRSASPDAPIVLRTLGPPPSPDAGASATADRSLIWGGISVTTAGAVGALP